MSDPIQPTLAFCEESKRMRISYATKRVERPIQEVWAVWLRHVHKKGDIYYRCYLFSHPTNKGTSYTLSDASNDVDTKTLIQEIKGSRKWKDVAKDLWMKKFGPSAEGAIKEGTSDVESSSKTTKQHEDEDLASTDEEQLLTDWNTYDRDLSDPQLHYVAALMQRIFNSKQPPAFHLIKRVRRTFVLVPKARLGFCEDCSMFLSGDDDRSWKAAFFMFGFFAPNRWRESVMEDMAGKALEKEKV